MNNKSKLHRAITLALAVPLLSSASGVIFAAEDIQEVIIFGTQGRLDSVTASRLDLSVLETPATVDVIDGNAIRARIDTSVIEAVTRSAGFTSEANPGNGHSSIAARGFRGQGSVTKLYDGSNYFTAAGTITFPFDTWGVEQIEVLKGPSSVLFGEGGIGGAINIIPRTPQFERSGAVRLMMGQDNSSFIGIDYTDSINDSLAYRLDYSNKQSDNWVNNGESDAEMFSFALLWNVSNDLILTARYDRGDQSPMKYFGVPIANGNFIPSLLESNFNVADAIVSYEDDSIRVKADWSISDDTNLQTEIYRLSTDRYWSNTEFYEYDDTTEIVTRWDPLVIGHDMTHNGLRSNLSSAFVQGRLKTSVGFEVNDISFVRPSNFGPGNPNRVNFGTDIDTVDSNNFQPGTLLDLTTADVMLDNTSDVRQYALFSEAQFALTDQLSLVGALRFDDFSTQYVRLGRATINQDADALTGRIGAVFDLSETTAIYAQYGTGATHPSSSVVTASASNRESDLIESEQFEIGIKKQVNNTRLQWNAAIFDIVKNNLTEDDPDSADPSDVIVIPEQSSRGIELGLNYDFVSGLQLYGNVSFLNAETDTGVTPTYVPEKTANLGFAWNFLNNFRVIADARYVGERFHSARPIPGYTVIDASLYWNVNNNLGITLKADNLFDELYASSSYYSSTWLVGKPRTLSIAADFSF
ncbi:MAG: membrane receptor protein [SAR86 cluster bacterium]|uniref:Membrane receptor protein n=1 Tax=SAR86 cluster bacterium TaxID=2030880 RepID=A0A2A5CEB9_9GAMM|nr:MAG: membrane receptor protein [SAR86 cluster bacterium]